MGNSDEHNREEPLFVYERDERGYRGHRFNPRNPVGRMLTIALVVGIVLVLLLMAK
ncbi:MULTISPECIES: hypothetical protein [unclassified Streptomyces]|uniref:hypothetical protein n=1 Tax=unclassified Streptomyces TaxID=2593676 RepID=UPI003323983C